MLVFEERGNRSTRRKPLGAEQRTNKLNLHMTPDLGVEARPHWWEASALTTVPSLHPLRQKMHIYIHLVGAKESSPSNSA